MKALATDARTVMEKQAFQRGREDGVMRRPINSPYPVRSFQERKYLAGFEAGQKHRAFLDARGMRHLIRAVEQTAQGWHWSVTVEGKLEAEGVERTRKLADRVSEDRAYDLSFME